MPQPVNAQPSYSTAIPYNASNKAIEIKISCSIRPNTRIYETKSDKLDENSYR